MRRMLLGLLVLAAVALVAPHRAEAFGPHFYGPGFYGPRYYGPHVYAPPFYVPPVYVPPVGPPVYYRPHVRPYHAPRRAFRYRHRY